MGFLRTQARRFQAARSLQVSSLPSVCCKLGASFWTRRSAALWTAPPIVFFRRAGPLELELQRELQKPRIADVKNLPKRRTLVRDVAVDGIELSMVPYVENVEAKFHLQPLFNGREFRKTHVPVVDARPAAYRAGSVADRARSDGRIGEFVGVEDKTSVLSNVLLDEMTRREPGVGVVVRLAGRFEIEGSVQLLNVIL